MEISGKLVSKLAEETGEGKNGKWVKQGFVIETHGQYPKKACFSLWGDKVSQLQNFQANDAVKVSFDVESREYNGRWYTDLRAWRIDAEGAGQQAPPTMPSFAAPSAAPTAAANDDVTGMSFSNDGDDLPF